MLCKKTTFFKTFVAILILIPGMYSFAYSQMKSYSATRKKKEVQPTITYCNLELSNSWKLGNLSFNSLYSFNVNEKGEVVNIKKIRDNFIGEEEVESCISKWRIIGVPTKSPFTVYFNWKHGKGWVEQRISGNGFTNVMYADGVSTSSFAQSGKISSEGARQIAEKFVACAGYSTKSLPPDECREYKIRCNDQTAPCKFLEERAYGYFPQRQNGKKGWTIVFRTRGKLKSKITGAAITMNPDGTDVKLEETKVFLRVVENQYQF